MTGPVPDIKDALRWLENAAGRLDRAANFMEVCGTHTMGAFRSGLPSLLPANVSLRSGPGCPVCVTAQGEIDALIGLASLPEVTLCTYGDMLRVPGQGGSLEAQRGQGADVRVVYSAMDAVRLAQKQPHRQVVLAAVGFETTAPATAVAIEQAARLELDNFTVMASHKLVVPALHALLAAGDIPLDGLLCPGHVSVVIGGESYRPLVETYGIGCVVSGFEPEQMAAGLAELTRMAADARPALVNQYPEAVSPEGNRTAKALLDRVFEHASAPWRGLGRIEDSGLVLRSEYRRFDACKRFGLIVEDVPEPAGCRCGEVITSRVAPDQCPLFGRACTPTRPIGPCMVSSEGTCAAWFKYHRPHASLPVDSSPVPPQHSREAFAT